MIAWLITVKEVKQHFRDYRTLFFLLAFPIVLMLILGITLTNAFTSEVKLDGISVLVNDASSGELSRSFAAFEGELSHSGIAFEKLKPGMEGREEIGSDHYTAYVQLSDTGMSLYSSSSTTVESIIVQGMLSAFTDKYNAAAAVAQEADSAEVQAVFAGSGGNYVKDESVIPDRMPGSMDYYAMSMTVMVGLFGAMSAGGLISSERVRGTGVRLFAAPIRRSDIFIGKVMGNVVANTLCILIIVVFSKWVFKAYWGAHLAAVIAVLICEVIMATSFGIAANSWIKNGGGRGLIMLVVQLSSFIGGAYFPVADSGIMGTVAWLSPLRWANHALLSIIYNDDAAAAWPAMGFFLGAALLLLLSTVDFRRNREVV
ncbi:ABC transporter permease [Paenibacillus sacheonensis]|uniref:ABC transporter permease n=1 Tax=Paenibacillus sacheonensis TaxID=742054 RepID=A0A7X4YSJ4_9BACL|nr:ABC transporter permease [Paenibacillus sacheonensis]MBM7569236.1 ABC-2 type transport system permease protein [Paenibacillus sacheonensis]NBC71753.1 ABC transporter permease [Paenibacillus sacheonensis]